MPSKTESTVTQTTAHPLLRGLDRMISFVRRTTADAAAQKTLQRVHAYNKQSRGTKCVCGGKLVSHQHDDHIRYTRISVVYRCTTCRKGYISRSDLLSESEELRKAGIVALGDEQYRWSLYQFDVIVVTVVSALAGYIIWNTLI